MYSQLH